jgi:hypothetical protein
MIIPLFIPFMVYMVFYDKITIKPSEAGFWMIITMGIAIGVLITRLFAWKQDQNKNNTK